MGKNGGDMKRLQGKVALITGASRGIGRGIALCLADEGADIVVNYRSHAEEAQQVAEAVTSMGRRVLAWQADVSDRHAVAGMVTATVEHFGHIDIAVANAATENHGPVIETRWEDDLRTFEVTQFGVFHTCKLCAQQMVKQVLGDRTGGKIIIISSVCADIPIREKAAYNMSKAAINHLGRTMAAELIRYRINVNTISPGWIDTPGEREMYGDSMVDEAWKQIPWGRLGTAEDIAKAVLYLTSDDADFVTGATLLVDGGQTLNCGDLVLTHSDG